MFRLFLIFAIWSSNASGFTLEPEFLSDGYTGVTMISPANIKKMILADTEKKNSIKNFCERADFYFQKYEWESSPCGDIDWQVTMTSQNKNALVYAEFGDGEETTLVLGGVHPDELTPIPIAFRFAQHLHKNPHLYEKQGIKVIVAPLVNPDGFFRNVATRTNANGVDPNRNFFTMDWYDKAKKVWIKRRGRGLRYFPGYFPNSEIETLFQISLIDRFKPDKILSVHAPLGFLDYDGPGDRKPHALSPIEDRAKRLVRAISEKSKNYKVVDYSFYPGSLGNFAGNERATPTVTLELETTRPDMVDAYWKQFLPGILQSIHYPFTNQDKLEGNATQFSDQYPPEKQNSEG